MSTDPSDNPNDDLKFADLRLAHAEASELSAQGWDEDNRRKKAVAREKEYISIRKQRRFLLIFILFYVAFFGLSIVVAVFLQGFSVAGFKLDNEVLKEFIRWGAAEIVAILVVLIGVLWGKKSVIELLLDLVKRGK